MFIYLLKLNAQNTDNGGLNAIGILYQSTIGWRRDSYSRRTKLEIKRMCKVNDD